MIKICFATNNHHKLEEVTKLLVASFDLVGLSEIGFRGELAEDFYTLEDNSRQKAEFVFRNFKLPCFADDTGLEVEALNGEPGAMAAHFAGPQRNSEDNVNLLLQKMAGIANRTAQFRTVITLIESSGREKQFEGIVKGTIALHPKCLGGFGYDPVFVANGFNKTMAEMTMAEKNAISHRGIAIRKLVDYLNLSDFE